MIRKSTYALLLFLLLGVFQAHAQWEQVRYRGNMYVTLDSFCEFYSFKHAGNEGDKTLLFSGPYGTLKLVDEGRECYINGRKVWLALNMTTSDSGKRLISYVDVVKMMEPVLRPNKVKRLKPIKGVVIDAGHGGTDNGARGRYGLMEKNMTLDTAQRLEKILKAAGIPTVMTRRTDVFVPLEQRAAIAAQYPNYLFVAIHFNQGQSEASGIETFALTPQYAPSTDSAGVMRVSDATRENGNRNDEANILLADFIHQEVRKLHPATGDRGVKRARFVVLRLNPLPSTLVEGGFLSNPGDAKMIGSTTYRDKLAAGIAKGIRRFIALSKGDAGTDIPDTDTPDTTPTPAPAPAPATPAKPALPEAPRPLDPAKVPADATPAKSGKPSMTPTSGTKSGKNTDTPAAKPGKTADTPAAKPSKTTDAPATEAAPAKTPAKTPETPDKSAEPATTKPAVKTPAEPAPKPGAKPKTPDKPKATDKPAAKPVKVPAKVEEPQPDIPQMNAAQPAKAETPAPVPDPEPAPRPIPVIETAPPPVKKAGPLIETSPAPRPKPAPAPAAAAEPAPASQPAPSVNTTPEPAEP